MNSVLLIGMPGMGEWVIIGMMFFLFIPLLILPIIALIDILKSQFKNENDKLVWVLVILFLPIIGSILYFIIGRKQRTIPA